MLGPEAQGEAFRRKLNSCSTVGSGMREWWWKEDMDQGASSGFSNKVGSVRAISGAGRGWKQIAVGWRRNQICQNANNQLETTP